MRARLFLTRPDPGDKITVTVNNAWLLLLSLDLTRSKRQFTISILLVKPHSFHPPTLSLKIKSREKQVSRFLAEGNFHVFHSFYHPFPMQTLFIIGKSLYTSFYFTFYIFLIAHSLKCEITNSLKRKRLR